MTKKDFYRLSDFRLWTTIILPLPRPFTQVLDAGGWTNKAARTLSKAAFFIFYIIPSRKGCERVG